MARVNNNGVEVIVDYHLPDYSKRKLGLDVPLVGNTTIWCTAESDGFFQIELYKQDAFNCDLDFRIGGQTVWTAYSATGGHRLTSPLYPVVKGDQINSDAPVTVTFNKPSSPEEGKIWFYPCRYVKFD